MVQPEFRGHRKRYSAPESLSRRQKNLLLHADMPKETCTKLIVGDDIDLTVISQCRLEQRIESLVVLRQKALQRPRGSVFMCIHHDIESSPVRSVVSHCSSSS